MGKKKRHEHQQRRRTGDGRRAASEAGPSSGHQRREARASGGRLVWRALPVLQDVSNRTKEKSAGEERRQAGRAPSVCA
jgi:hypothetical protein